MYAETGLMFPYFHNFSHEVQQLEDFCKPNAFMENLVQTSTIWDYDLGEEGDLFKAPESIIEEPPVGLDPMTDAISMISCEDNVISTQTFKVADIESIQSEQFLSEIFYECKNDLLAKEAIETPLSEVLDIKIPVTKADEKLLPEGPFQKSISSGCLNSMDWVHGAQMRPNFLDFPGIDFGADYGMRRALSEGDIKPQIISNCTSEDRSQKLTRYRNKKTKRNFGRKIKYACRKALADSQPRIRGRFAKTDESDTTSTKA